MILIGVLVPLVIIVMLVSGYIVCTKKGLVAYRR